MPPRHVYWTIIVGGMPTAFRAHSQEELLPTLRQLQAKHPDAVMKWFARGKLWDSDEQERLARHRRRTEEERRGRDWRPGGEHKDPRERFRVPRDVKRQRFKVRLQRDRSDRGGWNREGHERPAHGKRPFSPRGPHERSGKPPWNAEGRGDRSGDRREWNRESRPRRSPNQTREWDRAERPPGGRPDDQKRGPGFTGRPRRRDTPRSSGPGGWRKPGRGGANKKKGGGGGGR